MELAQASTPDFVNHVAASSALGFVGGGLASLLVDKPEKVERWGAIGAVYGGVAGLVLWLAEGVHWP